ncbi:MAG: hypothetical protein VXA34_00175 [Gammaproteobacteria bacterium]
MTSVIKVDTIQNSSGTSSMSIASNGFVIPPAGGIIQTQYTMFTGTNSYSITSSTNTKITDLAVNITPTSVNSVIKIETFVTGEQSDSNSHYNSVWFFYRDNTPLIAPNAGNRYAGIAMGSNINIWTSEANSTAENANYMYFDTPSTTSQVTYTVGYFSNYTSSFYLNRTVADTDAAQYERGISSICVTEIAG